ncbi:MULTISPECIES: ABC transporter ATP-binding protein [Kitasatospora]|uniref:Putative peptide ABC transporter ATP-binding protein n=1 Tax=Kitasatospora setae (strain ATCC 33774 / DSM 43861 / JCM 3304 / KCC A-0304 / NBRC 14216 / KM-6054) TaxID=452652 RepID=E4NJR4_KITSK|nr:MULTISPECIES: ABC transporter ATP-binding protein [Kitasatospora]BAJ33212.1 putative peptide ABC transporter ATP-binding protein [Kitasatospora setae KM-6054]
MPDESRSPAAELLRIEDLHVSFATDAGPAPAVRGVSLSVAAGEALALVGESGSGKTVTARSVLGLLPGSAAAGGRVLLRHGDAGLVDVLGADRRTLRELRGTAAAMVFQEPSTALNPVFPIGWQLTEGLRAHGWGTRASRRARAIELLDQVGIPEPDRRAASYPHQLSGGQQQRAVIAMALALGARLLVADEPTTSLDVTVQAGILDLLRRLRDESDTALLLITHNMGVVADLADRVAVMRAGLIVEQAPVRELFAAPQHPYTRQLLAAVPDFGAAPARPEPPAATPADPSAATPADPSAATPADPSAATPADPSAEAPAGPPVVAARGLTVDYPGRLGRRPFRAVDGVDLEIRAGEVLGLVGGSGSGKTTIGRALAGLTGVTGGSLRVLGEELGGAARRRRPRQGGRLGFVFQDPATSFDPRLTIGACVAEPLRVHRPELDGPAVAARVRELLAQVRLPDGTADRHPHELSGGQRQRASLARALALDPELVIADEPTSALDVSVQARVLELFTRLQRELGFAALFVSHDLAVVERVADRVTVLHQGRVVETGPTARVLGDPRHAYTRQLIAALPVPDPDRQAERRAALLSRRQTGATPA